MRRLLFIFITLFAFTSPHAHAGPDPYSLIDEDLAHHVAALQEKGIYSVEDFTACQITSSVQELVSTDPSSKIIPFEITLYYGKNKILKLINYHGQSGRELEGLYLNCVEFNNYVYLFFDMKNFDLYRSCK